MRNKIIIFVAIMTLLLPNANFAASTPTKPANPPKINVKPKIRNIKPPEVQLKDLRNKSIARKIKKSEIFSAYDKIGLDEWETYFSKQTKIIRKAWKKESLLKNKKYSTSYAKVVVAVDKTGEFVWYEIKGSCVPKGNTQFISSVEKLLSNIDHLPELPSGYTNNFLVYTIEFHSYLSGNINPNDMNWDKYGVAIIKIGKNTSYIKLK